MLRRMKRISDPDPDEADLLDWGTAAKRADWKGLLVGNGASIACWEAFDYRSIYKEAQDEDRDHPLSDDDVAVFDAFRTTNFEQVLAGLKTATIVLSALGYKTDFLKERYESVQDALFDAVHSVHLPWGVTEDFEERLQTIRHELLQYEWVYSLNYDLILYWAVMSEERGRGIADFFWNTPGNWFDPAHAVLDVCPNVSTIPPRLTLPGGRRRI